MSGALNPVLDGGMATGIRSLLCDSIELEGANWTGNFTAVLLLKHASRSRYLIRSRTQKTLLSSGLIGTVKLYRIQA